MVSVCMLLALQTNAVAASWYAGMYKPDYTYTGISANIKTPSSFPTISSIGESTWVTCVTADDY